MEEIRSIAEASYANASPDTQELVKSLFQAMDVNRNGSINLIEFTNYMIRSYPKIYRAELFEELDQDGKGCLNFQEVITLWFMLNKRNFCDGNGCRRILTTTFYTCYTCFQDKSKERWFALCLSCYTNKNHAHQHDWFLDHYEILSRAWWTLREQVSQVAPSRKPTFSIQDISSQAYHKEIVYMKCKLKNRQNIVVAEGRLESTDPKILVYHVPLGYDYVKVWVDTALDPKAALLRPTPKMSIIEHAVGTTIAWHRDFICFD